MPARVRQEQTPSATWARGRRAFRAAFRLPAAVPAAYAALPPILLAGTFVLAAGAGHDAAVLLLPLAAALLADVPEPDSQLLDENGRRVFRALVRLKERGEIIRQEDIAREAGIGERTLVTYKANSALLAGLIDEAILFCMDQHLQKIARRLQAEGGAVTCLRIAAEANVAPETLRRRREANPELNRVLEDILSSTHPSDLNIFAAVQRLKSQPGAVTLADVAREADVHPGTLKTRMYGNPKVRDAVNAVVLSTDSRILKALDELLREGGDVDQAAVAERARLDPETVASRRKSNAMIREALDQAIRSTDERILVAVEELTAGNEEITQRRIGEEAGVAEGTVSRRKAKNPRVQKAVEEAVSRSTYRRIAAAIERLNDEGVPVTQQAIAARLGLSESAIAYYKEHDPDVFELIEDALPLSALERVRQAREELLAEDIPCTQRNLALRAGVSRSAVSRVIANNPELGGGVMAAPPRQPWFPTAEVCNEALAARIRIYGNEMCNAAAVLRRPTLRGGNPALLRACRRLHIPLPAPRRERAKRLAAGKAVLFEVNPLVSFLERIGTTKALLEVEAIALWEKARHGDKEAKEELLVRARPMIRFVIEKNLHEEIAPFGFKTDLLWRLISEGDWIIASAADGWDRSGRFLWFLYRRLRDGLRRTRLDFFRERKRQAQREVPLSEPLGGETAEDGTRPFTLEDTPELAAGNVPPDQVVGILTEPSAFGEEELIAKRDLASGVPVVSRYDKQVLASILRPVFSSADMRRTLEGGLDSRWAAFMVNSVGRMGTAVVGRCSFRALVLSEATPAFLRRAVAALAETLSAAFREKPGGLSGLVIGRSPDYDRVMERVRGQDRRWDVLRHLVMGVQRFGIGLTPEDGIAAVDFMTVEGGADDPMLFELLKNGILVAESEDGARSALVRRILGQQGTRSPEDACRALLDAQVSFLRDQRARLEWIKRRLERSPTAFR